MMDGDVREIMMRVIATDDDDVDSALIDSTVVYVIISTHTQLNNRRQVLPAHCWYEATKPYYC